MRHWLTHHSPYLSNSAFENFIHMYCEHISSILCKIKNHVSTQITTMMPKRTKYLRVLYVNHPLLKSRPFCWVKSTPRYIAIWNTEKSRWSTPLSVASSSRGVAGLLRQRRLFCRAILGTSWECHKVTIPYSLAKVRAPGYSKEKRYRNICYC